MEKDSKKEHPFVAYLREQLDLEKGHDLEDYFIKEFIPKNFFVPGLPSNSFSNVSILLAMNEEIKNLNDIKKVFPLIISKYLKLHNDIFENRKVQCMVSDYQELTEYGKFYRCIFSWPGGFIQVLAGYDKITLANLSTNLESVRPYRIANRSLSEKLTALLRPASM